MSNSDKFFTQTTCDRCKEQLIARTMSWFTEETICMDCYDKEVTIRQKLKAKGITDTYEGCGYIPKA